MNKEIFNIKTIKPKSETVKLNKLYVDLSGKYNPARTVGGQLDGITVTDNRDIPGMEQAIFERGGIQRSLWVLSGSPLCPEKDKYFVFVGNRRGTAALEASGKDPLKLTELYGAEMTSKTLESFNSIPVLVYPSTGTEEGDLDMILALGNDQDQKAYNLSGLYNAVKMAAEAGKGPHAIAQLYGEQILALSDKGRTKLAELRKMTNPKERATALTDGLKGTLGDVWLVAIRLGGEAQKALHTKLLKQDGLTTEEPSFDPSRGNMAKLLTARNTDGADYHPDRGGVAFNAALNEIKEPKDPKDGNLIKRPKPEEVKAVYEMLKSEPTRLFYEWQTGVQGATRARAVDADKTAYKREEMERLWLNLRTTVTHPHVLSVMNAFISNDLMNLSKAVAALPVPKETAAA
jgi:hypothetical protein